VEQIPQEPMAELKSFQEYRDLKGSCLLCDYMKTEQRAKERIIVENEDFICLVPFWAVWPYETILISKRHLTHLLELNNRELSNLADIMRIITCRYDNLFETSFPYSMGIHQAPTDGKNYTQNCHFHIVSQ